MRIRFAEVADRELRDAIDWYELQQAGLGRRFKREVREAVLRIAGALLLFPISIAARITGWIMPNETLSECLHGRSWGMK